MATTRGMSCAVMVSFTEGAACGGAAGAVLVPAPLSGTAWVKFDATGVLVRLLIAALSVNVMLPVGVPEGGAT